MKGRRNLGFPKKLIFGGDAINTIILNFRGDISEKQCGRVASNGGLKFIWKNLRLDPLYIGNPDCRKT